jgi:hypothetical protein
MSRLDRDPAMDTKRLLRRFIVDRRVGLGVTIAAAAGIVGSAAAVRARSSTAQASRATARHAEVRRASDTGPIMPLVVLRPVADAQREVASVLGPVSVTSTVVDYPAPAPEVVIGQIPAAGTSVSATTSVTLFVSSGHFATGPEAPQARPRAVRHARFARSTGAP